LNDNGFVEFFGNDWNKTYAAFRLESERFPGLTAKDGSYTKEEFRDFQIMAARYGINVVPEILFPFF
jgi:hexosaminidase